MKPLAFVVVAATCLAGNLARAQFPNFPAADLVLGATDFTTVGTGAATPSGTHSPSGLAIDPQNGKLFVASEDHHRVLRFPSVASLANGADAEAVFGQLNFSGTSSGTTATKLSFVYDLHVDGNGRLWVPDFDNNRVLMFLGASSLGNGATPDLVLGQPDFTTVTSGTSTTKMRNPTGAFIDSADILWVADFGNHRVLRFANASGLANGAAADGVLGQPNFTTGTSGLSAVKMNRPLSMKVDASGRLWIAEQSNHRVLRFDGAATLTDGSAATAVLGQPDFVTNSPATTDRKMSQPKGLLIDPAGTLYVADHNNGRILIFKNAAAKASGDPADGVIGQPDFTSNAAAVTARNFDSSTGLAQDPAGRLWVGDLDNNRVLRFSPDRSAVPPSVARVPKVTSNSKLTVKGTASDASGITQVRFRVGKGAFQAASGTTAWTFKAKLKPGKNTLEIVMVDAVGNTSPPKRLTVTRR